MDRVHGVVHGPGPWGGPWGGPWTPRSMFCIRPVRLNARNVGLDRRSYEPHAIHEAGCESERGAL